MTGESERTPKPRLTESKLTRRHGVAAEPSAFDRILVYSQYGSNWFEWPLNDGDSGGNNMENSGCLIFAYAHAVQWLTGNRVSPENRAGLIEEFIRVCDIPWGPRAYNPTDPQALYSAHILDQYPIAQAPVPRSASATAALFRQGGVIIANPGGHYVLAVGGAYRRFEGSDGDEYFIHIVDSSCQSTWWRTNQNHGSALYDFNGLGVIQGYRREEGRPVDGTVDGKAMSKWTGGEYWAPFSVFSRYRLDRAFVPGEGTFGGMPWSTSAR